MLYEVITVGPDKHGAQFFHCHRTHDRYLFIKFFYDLKTSDKSQLYLEKILAGFDNKPVNAGID